MALSPANLAFRAIALDGMANTARGFGFTEEEIAKARAECERTNTDKAFQDMIMGRLSSQFPKLFE